MLLKSKHICSPYTDLETTRFMIASLATYHPSATNSLSHVVDLFMCKKRRKEEIQGIGWSCCLAAASPCSFIPLSSILCCNIQWENNIIKSMLTLALLGSSLLIRVSTIETYIFVGFSLSNSIILTVKSSPSNTVNSKPPLDLCLDPRVTMQLIH